MGSGDYCSVTPNNGGIHVGGVTIKPEEISDFLDALGSAMRQTAEAIKAAKPEGGAV